LKSSTATSLSRNKVSVTLCVKKPKSVPKKAVDSEVFGLPTVNGTLFLERHAAVEV